MKKFKLIIEKNKDGFWGQVDKLESVFSHGETTEELLANTKETIELYYEIIDKSLPNYEFSLNL